MTRVAFIEARDYTNAVRITDAIETLERVGRTYGLTFDRKNP
jgi:hypothetical protein